MSVLNSFKRVRRVFHCDSIAEQCISLFKIRFLKNVKQKQPALAIVCCSLHSITTRYGLLTQRTVRFSFFNSWQTSTSNDYDWSIEIANFSERRLTDYVNNLTERFAKNRPLLPESNLCGKIFRSAVVLPQPHESSRSQQVWSLTSIFTLFNS